MLLADATPGTALSAEATMYPSRLEVVSGEVARPEATSTTYGYVLDGDATLVAPGLSAVLAEGAYFAAPGAFSLSARGRVVLITRVGFLGLLHVGAIEARGRLAYIDGCSDTLLVSPPRLGDPVLNHLHFPAGITQSEHLHPSVRLGVVARGAGFARLRDGERPLARGAVFLLDAHERHAFRTTGEPMDVIAFHPDSDWGPTDAAHPMRSRTYLLGGRSKLSRPSRVETEARRAPEERAAEAHSCASSSAATRPPAAARGSARDNFDRTT